MINSSLFRIAYEKFYTEMRNYLWNIPTLELLAAVEVETYQSFVDAKELERKLSKLYMAIKKIADDDEYLKKAYDDFYNLVEDNLESEPYFALYKVEEV